MIQAPQNSWPCSLSEYTGVTNMQQLFVIKMWMHPWLSRTQESRGLGVFLNSNCSERKEFQKLTFPVSYDEFNTVFWKAYTPESDQKYTGR